MNPGEASVTRDELAESVLVASRALVAIAASSMPDADEVTLAQYRALVVLASHGPITAGRLSELLEVHPSTVTRLIDRLETKQFTTRSSTDDRREVVIALAPSGSRLLATVTADRRRLISAVLERLPADDLDDLLRSFRAFSEAAGEVPDSQWSDVLDLPAGTSTQEHHTSPAPIP